VRKVCVIGGSGFIGSVLIRQLAPDHGLLNIDIQPNASLDEYATSVLCDVRDREQLTNQLAGQDQVVLLAAEHADNVSPASKYYEVNVDGARNVVDAMDAHGVRRILFTSTVAVYGLNKDNPDENHPLDAFNDYGKSKVQAEEVLMEWARKGDGRSVSIVRPTVVFGEGNRGNVYNLIRSIHDHKFLMVGRGDNRKSMAYVENVAAFLRFLLDTDNRPLPDVEIFNYTDRPDLEMTRFVGDIYNAFGHKPPRLRMPYPAGMLAGMAFDLLAKVSGRTFPISSQRIRKFCATTAFDSRRKEAIGFTAPYTLTEGLQRMVAHDFT
jgi:nucleoside-diphosphate-sugar epimerase